MFFLLRPLAAPAHQELTGIAAFVEKVKPILPIPVLAIVVTAIWFVFRKTWRELDLDAQQERAAILEKGKIDHRPVVALVLCALILTMQEYYGGRLYYDTTIHPWLVGVDATHPGMQLGRYDELYGFGWWAGTRIFGYTLPFALWKIIFREDSLLDLGLRTRGFFAHAWIYMLFLLVVLPPMFIVSRSPDFGSYYPFYKQSTRSWFDFLCWEAMYFGQFFALEMFFRGFWLGSLRRSFGSGAIFVMAVPYCMIHYGKPYLEACGAIVAGIALGSLSMKTKSIYQGFLVHITVAISMDWLSLRHRHATPLHFWVTDPPRLGEAYLAEEAAREVLAKRVDTIAAIVFAILIALLALAFARTRQKAKLAAAGAGALPLVEDAVVLPAVLPIPASGEATEAGTEKD